jgi:hypothetical protein
MVVGLVALGMGFLAGKRQGGLHSNAKHSYQRIDSQL